MFKFINFKRLTSVSTLSVLMTGSLISSPAISTTEENVDATSVSGTVSPSGYNKDIVMTQTASLERTVTVSIDDVVETITTTGAPDKLDVLFLADNTGSMGGGISNVQTNASSLLNSLDSTYNDVQYGVARYYGDPKEIRWEYEDTGEVNVYTKTYTYTGNTYTCGWSSPYTCYEYKWVKTKNGAPVTNRWGSGYSYYGESTASDYGNTHTVTWESPIYDWVNYGEIGATAAYELQEAVDGGTKGNAIAAINQWSASGGDDWAEANFFALHQAATSGASTTTGYSTGYNTNWRDDAMKIIVWFGDAESHTNTVSQAEAIAALNAQGITVVAIHTTTMSASITNGLDANSQASSISTATNGQYASVYSSELASTMQTLIGTAAVETTTTTITPTIDLAFSSEGNTDGLDIIYTCSDALGCDDVKNGESRKFTMEVTGNAAGRYTFKTIVNDVDGAEADNNINVFVAD